MRVMSGQDRCFYSEGAGASFDAGTTEDEGKPASFCRTPPPSGETRIHSCGSSLLPRSPGINTAALHDVHVLYGSFNVVTV